MSIFPPHQASNGKRPKNGANRTIIAIGSAVCFENEKGII